MTIRCGVPGCSWTLEISASARQTATRALADHAREHRVNGEAMRPPVVVNA